MLAYNTAKQDYRTYKLVRMEDVCITEDEFSKEHKSAQDILNAIAIGIVSGLASTGIDQAYKQQKKG